MKNRLLRKPLFMCVPLPGRANFRLLSFFRVSALSLFFFYVSELLEMRVQKHQANRDSTTVGYTLSSAQSIVLNNFFKTKIRFLIYDRMEMLTKNPTRNPNKKAQKRRNQPRRPKMRKRWPRRRETLKMQQRRPKRRK